MRKALAAKAERFRQGCRENVAFTEHDTFVFGRMNDCHACIPDDTQVSRHDFILEVNPPAACLRDLGSLNGTHVNGDKFGAREKGETPEQGAKRRHPRGHTQTRRCAAQSEVSYGS